MSHKPCYGKMFPDVLDVKTNQATAGKVLSYRIESKGLTRSGRSVSIDVAAWDDCMACSEFDSCYRLSSAKLMLEGAIRDA